MDYLAENSAPVWVAGAILLTMALIVYFHSRSNRALLAVFSVVALTAAGLLAERLVVTPREQVESTLRELLVRVEANDLPGVLGMVSSQPSTLAADAQTLMPLFDIHKARATGEVEVSLDPDATTAAAGFRFFADVRHKRSGTKGGYWDEVTLEFVREGDQWKVSGYSTGKDWRKDAARL